MTSPFEKFFEDLERDRSGASATKPGSGTPPKPSDSRAPSPPSASGAEAVMSDSGLFDVGAIVPAARGGKPPAGVSPRPTLPAPGAKSAAEELIGSLKMPAPTSRRPPTGSPVPDAVMSDSGLFDNRGSLPDQLLSAQPLSPAGHPPAGSPVGSHRPPVSANSVSSPPLADSEAVMSDSGLFDVREMIPPGGKPGLGAPATKPSGRPASAQTASKPAAAPGKGSSAQAGLAAKAPVPPTSGVEDSPIMSDSGLFDMREMMPGYKSPASPTSKPPASKSPKPVGAVVAKLPDGSAGSPATADSPSRAAIAARAAPGQAMPGQAVAKNDPKQDVARSATRSSGEISPPPAAKRPSATAVAPPASPPPRGATQPTSNSASPGFAPPGVVSQTPSFDPSFAQGFAPQGVSAPPQAFRPPAVSDATYQSGSHASVGGSGSQIRRAMKTAGSGGSGSAPALAGSAQSPLAHGQGRDSGRHPGLTKTSTPGLPHKPSNSAGGLSMPIIVSVVILLLGGGLIAALALKLI